MLARQPQADVILRQEKTAEALPQGGLMDTNPQQLRQSKVRQGGITGVLDQALLAYLRIQLVALGGGTLITPDQRRPNHLIRLVEQHRSKHLAGEPNARDLIARNGGFPQSRGNRFPASLPPVFGMLLRPPALR